MIQFIRLLGNSLGNSLPATLAALALACLFTASANAGEQPVPSSERSLDSTQFTRLPEGVQPPAKLAPTQYAKAPAVTCDAAQNQADVLGTIRQAEMELAKMREMQLSAWAAKGWSAKEAAAAGEAVALNGSGYNITGTPLR